MFSNAFSQLPTPKLPSLAQHPPINEGTSIMFRVRNCWMVTHAAHDDSGHFGISKPGFKPISSPSLGNCSSYRRKVPGNAGNASCASAPNYLFCSLGTADSRRATKKSWFSHFIHPFFMLSILFTACGSQKNGYLTAWSQILGFGSPFLPDFLPRCCCFSSELHGVVLAHLILLHITPLSVCWKFRTLDTLAVADLVLLSSQT